jgi:hypothetical protein
VYKAHLHAFFMALKSYFPEYGSIWKLEYQRRGAAHYHCFLYGVSLEAAQELIPRLWYQVVGSNDENHLLFHQGKLKNSRPCVEEVRTWHGVKSYASKYLSKVPRGDQESGRYWGCVGRVPMSKIMQFRIDLEVANAFRRAVRKRTGYNPRRYGFWANCYHPDWLKWIEQMQNESEEARIPESFPPGWWKSRPVEEQPMFTDWEILPG